MLMRVLGEFAGTGYRVDDVQTADVAYAEMPNHEQTN